MDITEQHKELFESLMALIRSSSSLNSLDIDFVRSMSPQLASRSANASQRLLTLVNSLIAKCNGNKLDTPFLNSDDMIKRWRSVEQTFDLLMDKIDAPSTPAPQKVPVSEGLPAKEYMRIANNIAKPQLNFNTKIDNSKGPFKPLLTQKPFANCLPLSQSIAIQQPDAEHEHEWYQQPYNLEIMNSEYPPVSKTGMEIPDWNSTPMTYVDTPDLLFKMVSKLEKATEIAVDVEHHDYRSYLGLVCLLQITGAGEDYIVDTLALRSELQVLNKVFANPQIVKILHGAKMDIVWLQRDLGVYIVSLFDTYYAAQELCFPKLSLAYLLEQFAGFEAQKKYQLADWRMRPLPQELLDYARADTHFLIYIYHQLKEKLLEVGRYDAVLEESRKVAAKRFENPGWNELEPSWVNFAIKYRLHGNLGRAILIRLFEWRDKMARKYDESPRYVMSPQFMANLCVSKPRTGTQVLEASHNVSPIVRKNAASIAKLIQETCKNPNAVDTTIPERAYSAASAVPHTLSEQESDSLKTISQFMFEPKHFYEKMPTEVCLSVVLPEDLARAQEFNEAAAEKEEAQRLQAKQEAETARKAAEEENRIREQRLKAQNDANASVGKGKRLNIVEDNDEFELSASIKRENSKPVKEDVPAFDFGSADKIMKTDTDTSKSFSRYKSDKHPKGAHKNNSRFKKARSFR